MMNSSYNETIDKQKIFKLLSDETRVRVLKLLNIKCLCLCELSGILKVPNTNLSNHLALLKAQEIVIGERKDKWVYYSINPEKKGLITSLLNLLPTNEEDIKRLKKCLSGKFVFKFCRNKRKLCPHKEER